MRGFSFSWRRALGVSAAQGRLSRAIGIPLSKSGRQRKIGRLAAGSIASLFVEASAAAITASARSAPRKDRASPSPTHLGAADTFGIIMVMVVVFFLSVAITGSATMPWVLAIGAGVAARVYATRTSRQASPALPSLTPTAGTLSLREQDVTIITRGGQAETASEAFLASNSSSMPRRLAALSDEKAHPVDRHFLLMGIVQDAYRARKSDPAARARCEEIGRLHVAELPTLIPFLRKEFGMVPSIPTYQLLATCLAESGNTDDAVAVCREAIRLGIGDGTQSGFEGRIARIIKRAGHEPARGTT